MEIIGKIQGLTKDIADNSFLLTIKTYDKNVINDCNNLKDKDKLNIKIKPYRKNRSIDANSYCWVLCKKIADVIKTTKEDVYKMAIKDVGVFECIAIRKEATDRFIENWGSKGIGWFCEKSGLTINNQDKLFAYYGSSVYNTKEMSILIDYLIDEAKQLDIETMSPNELKSLKESWKNEKV